MKMLFALARVARQHMMSGRHALANLPWQLGALLSVWVGVAQGQPLDLPIAPVATTTQPAHAVPLMLNNRKIVTFRTDLLGDAPADRAELARLAVSNAMEAKGPGVVTRVTLGDSVRIELDGQPLFFVLPGDLGGPRPAGLLDAASQEVVQRLQTAVNEAHERTDPKKWAIGAAYSLLATLVAWVLMRMLLSVRRRATLRVHTLLREQGQHSQLGTWLVDYVNHARTATRAATAAVTWALILLLVDAWATFVFHQFAYTRPWGERSTAWLLELFGQFVSAMASAVPGVLTAALIFVLARAVARASSGFLHRIESGEIHVAWLDADTAVPTRRLSTAGIWLFALAMAYPYLPGAGSEAFKGVSVLAGLMLSLGASSVVGQALSGLSLMYSRSLRVGEYVKVGDVEGTVAGLGMFTTRIHTGLGEEVSLPNSVVFSQPIRNFSRMVNDGRFMIHTTVTIGYATPWRQVHAMLMEGAKRSQGVAIDPPPYVVQTALSDFYVEYRLCAQSSRDAPAQRASVISQLLSNVQDVFNENGVQIMSPHYMADTAEPQVVAPGPWASQAAPTAPAQSSAP
ncbi:MAG: mechanosensitive ion channel family protein [Burkholderiales bacterium]|nr:mechanosensitive ion channel family protein [Burkholderiales bacterium]